MMQRLLAWEWFHWSTRRDVRIAVFGMIAGSAIWSWLGAIAVQSDFVPAFLSGSEATGFTLAYRSMRGLAAFLALFVMLWSSASIAAELETGQLRMQLLRVRRSELVLAKALHLWLVSLAILFALLFVCWIAGAVAFGLQAVHVGPLTVYSARGLALSGLIALASSALPLAAFIALCVAVSASCHGARAATMLCVFAIALLWAVGQVGPLKPFDIVGAINRSWGVALSQAEGLKTSAHRDGLATLVLSSLAWTGVSLGWATWRFRRRDLK